jgi:AraC family transcriptional regulator, transcriptional activator of pobA
MATGRSTIPLHRLEETTDEGFHLERVPSLEDLTKEAILLDAHRDDHYIFFLVVKGKSQAMVDFHQFALNGNDLFFILPGQVHRYVYASKEIAGWFLAIDAGLIPDEFRAVLEDPLLAVRPVSPEAQCMEQMGRCLALAYDLNVQPATGFSKRAVYSLLTTFVAMVTNIYAQQRDMPIGKWSRSQVITRDFRALLTREYKQLKSPGDYAAALHLSLSYLNEAVKETTGCTVTYWIQQEIVLEAKRLLYHSSCSVKEVAYELGYDDPTYFSRLFKKTVNKTPGEFREQYRK